MTFDWGTMLGDMLDAIGDVITSFITSLSDNADTIAEILIVGVIAGAAIKFGNRIFTGITGAIKGIFD
jgi:hypothetical protein